MITSFHGENRFLSNFWPSEIIFNGETFPTVEHAYQASKTILEVEHDLIRLASTPGAAKRLGRKATVRSDWENIKEQVMHDCLVAKFRIPELRKKLIATGSEPLIEGNTWGDKFWGAVNENGNWRGQNKLGILLMHIRIEVSRIPERFWNDPTFPSEYN